MKPSIQEKIALFIFHNDDNIVLAFKLVGIIILKGCSGVCLTNDDIRASTGYLGFSYRLNLKNEKFNPR